MAPLAFLTELRLGLARRKLLAGTTTLAAIAAEVGYQSEGGWAALDPKSPPRLAPA